MFNSQKTIKELEDKLKESERIRNANLETFGYEKDKLLKENKELKEGQSKIIEETTKEISELIKIKNDLELKNTLKDKTISKDNLKIQILNDEWEQSQKTIKKLKDKNTKLISIVEQVKKQQNKNAFWIGRDYKFTWTQFEQRLLVKLLDKNQTMHFFLQGRNTKKTFTQIENEWKSKDKA